MSLLHTVSTQTKTFVVFNGHEKFFSEAFNGGIFWKVQNVVASVGTRQNLAIRARSLDGKLERRKPFQRDVIRSGHEQKELPLLSWSKLGNNFPKVEYCGRVGSVTLIMSHFLELIEIVGGVKFSTNKHFKFSGGNEGEGYCVANKFEALLKAFVL